MFFVGVNSFVVLCTNHLQESSAAFLQKVNASTLEFCAQLCNVHGKDCTEFVDVVLQCHCSLKSHSMPLHVLE